MKPRQSKKPNNPLHKVTWKETTIPEGPSIPCKHFFEFVADECRCNNCGMGLIGVYKLEDGKPVL